MNKNVTEKKKSLRRTEEKARTDTKKSFQKKVLWIQKPGDEKKYGFVSSFCF